MKNVHLVLGFELAMPNNPYRIMTHEIGLVNSFC